MRRGEPRVRLADRADLDPSAGAITALFAVVASSAHDHFDQIATLSTRHQLGTAWGARSPGSLRPVCICLKYTVAID